MQEPKRPAITPAQIAAVLIAGVPAVAKLLEAFGVYTLTAAQQDALTGALTWLGVLAGVLIASDAALRAARNAAHAKVAAATPAPPVAKLATGGTPTTGATASVYIDGEALAKSSLVDEPGDSDALPDYQTETDPPADEGDTSANGDTGERES